MTEQKTGESQQAAESSGSKTVEAGDAVQATHRKAAELLARLKKRDLPQRRDVGAAGSKNFTVIAPPGDFLCQKILAQAERYRKEIAITWLGEELSAGKEFTHINFEFSDEKDEGLTLLCGAGRCFSGDHRLWLATTTERAQGSTLAHEVAHIVLNSRFPAGMPAWANEGVASLHDDAERAARQKAIIREFGRSGHWPSLSRLLDMPGLPPTDKVSYAVAVSLTEYLLSLGDHATFLAFVQAGNQTGWDEALKRSYSLDGTAELQERWQAWVIQNHGNRVSHESK